MDKARTAAKAAAASDVGAPAAAAGRPMRACALCGSTRRTDAGTGPLQTCARCRKVYYCCLRHHCDHWGVHKAACPRPPPKPEDADDGPATSAGGGGGGAASAGGDGGPKAHASPAGAPSAPSAVAAPGPRVAGPNRQPAAPATASIPAGLGRAAATAGGPSDVDLQPPAPDANAPKKPLGPYMHFTKETRAGILAKNPAASWGEVRPSPPPPLLPALEGAHFPAFLNSRAALRPITQALASAR